MKLQFKKKQENQKSLIQICTPILLYLSVFLCLLLFVQQLRLNPSQVKHRHILSRDLFQQESNSTISKAANKNTTSSNNLQKVKQVQLIDEHKSTSKGMQKKVVKKAQAPKPGLTPEFINYILERGGDSQYLFCTFSDKNSLDFVRNWRRHLLRIGIKSYLVGALDSQSFKQLQSEGITTVQIADYQNQRISFLSPDFMSLGMTKIQYIMNMTQFNVTTVISDSDAFWLNDPRSYFDRYEDADILFPGENNTPTSEDDGLEYVPNVEFGINIGIMIVRPHAYGFIRDWYMRTQIEQGWDQQVFQSMVLESATEVDSPKRIFRQHLDLIYPLSDQSSNQLSKQSYTQDFKFGILPVKLFLNGNTYFVLRQHEYYHNKPYAVHVQNTAYGQFGKRFRFREENLWQDDDSYYNNQDAKYISLNIQVDEFVKLKSKPDYTKDGYLAYHGHIDLTNYQFRMLRNAMAFAWIFDRILILPRFLCGCKISPQGVVETFTKTNYPISCNADVFLNLQNIYSYPFPDKFAYNFQFREHSFLQNERIWPNISNDIISINECTPNMYDCADPDEPIKLKLGDPKNDGINVPIFSNDKQLFKMLANIQHFKVWELYNPSNIFGGFEDNQEFHRFTEQIKHYTNDGFRVSWTEPYIHYDLLWDIIPHVDQFGKEWNEAWHPVQDRH